MARLTRKGKETITLLLTLGVLLFVVLNSTVYFTRWDLTEDKTFTLSGVSRRLFREIPEEVTITYYLSSNLNARAPETQHIADILGEYEAFSRRRIDVRIVDPAATGTVQEAENLGVVPQQIQVVEENEQSFAVVYSGIVISYLDRYHTLPLVFDPAGIEYEVTSAIRNLVEDRTNVVGILIDQPGATLQQNFQILTGRLQRSYEIRPIEAEDPIPPDVRALLVIGGANLNTQALAEIDRYLMTGGGVLFAYDPVVVNVEQGLFAYSPEEQPIIDYLTHFGVTPRRELVLDESNRRIPIQVPQGQLLIQRLEPYPPWVSVLGSAADRNHPITARFSGLDLYWPSTFDITDHQESITVLLESSQESWIMEGPYMIDPIEPFGMTRGRDDGVGNYPLALAVSGSFERYFAEEGAVPADSSTDRLRMVVVGDSEFPSDYMQYTDARGNLVFLESALGWLANDEELLTIRTRGVRDLRLNAIEDPLLRARVATFAELFNMVMMPLLVVALGVIRFVLRRRRAAAPLSGGAQGGRQ